MTGRAMTDIEMLVHEFATLTLAQNEAIARDDPAAATRHARQRVAIFHALRGYGNRGRDALAMLMKDWRPGVRVMAAAYLLRHLTDEAIAVLEAAAEGEGLTAFAAAHALTRWYEGTWNYDPEDEDG
jgi:hypothetical protein